MNEKYTGKLFLILGSSGSGKGTVLKALMKKYPEFVFPISCTTREKRPSEKEGEIYRFITKGEFKRRIERDEFLEWAVVHEDDYYGTLKLPIEEALLQGKTVIREVDVQGLRSIREIINKGTLVSVFLMVPSWEILKVRILRRAKMSKGELERRYQSYLREQKWAEECDYVVESPEGRESECIANVEDVILKELGLPQKEHLE